MRQPPGLSGTSVKTKRARLFLSAALSVLCCAAPCSAEPSPSPVSPLVHGGATSSSDLSESPSRGDIEALRQLIFSLKDELDANDVRLLDLQDQLNTLQQHQAASKSTITIHGTATIDATGSDSLTLPHGVGAPDQEGLPPIDPLSSVFIRSSLNGDALTAVGPQDALRTRNRILIRDTLSTNLRINAPLDLVSDPLGPLALGGGRYRLAPALMIQAHSLGIFSETEVRAGTLDTLPSSLTGLSFSAPTDTLSLNDALTPAPWAQGVSVGSTVMGLTDLHLAYAQVNPLLISTSEGIAPLAGGVTGSYYAPLPDSLVHGPARTLFQARAVQHLADLPQATLGMTAVHIEDSPSAATRMDDTVLGLDLALPLTFVHTVQPLLYAESAATRFSSDLHTRPQVHDTATVVGLRTQNRHVAIDVHAQVVGRNFIVGTPPRYSNGVPGLISQNTSPIQPQVIGLGNTLAANRDFDAALRAGGLASSTATNPNASFVYPIVNPLIAPTYDTSGSLSQAYMPNSQGVTSSIEAPVRIGKTRLTTQAVLQHLEQVTPDSGSTANFVAPPATTQRLRYDAVTLSTHFQVPAFRRNVTLSLSSGYDHLLRNDDTTQAYYPYDTSAQSTDAAALAQANTLTHGTSPIVATPNHIDVHRYTYGAHASIPLVHHVDLGLGYSNQKVAGVYGSTPDTALAQRKDLYTGSLSYTPRGGRSSVTLVGREARYLDDNIPAANSTEVRGDLLYSVRF